MFSHCVFLTICLTTLTDGVIDVEPNTSIISSYEDVRDMHCDSLNVQFLGNWPFGPSCALACDSSRNAIFLGSGGGVYILDVSDPLNPIKISESIHTRGFVNGLFYDEGTCRLYIVGEIVGLEIWDVADLTSPLKLGFYGRPEEACAVYVSGSYAYLADGSNGLRVIDISNPSNPNEIGYYNTPGVAKDVHASGSYAYVADRSEGLRVIDVSDPTNPHEVGNLVSISANCIYFLSPYAYVAGDYGFAIIDVSNPANPQEIGHCYLHGLDDVCVSGSYAYVVSEGSFGFYVVDISDPADPQLIGQQYVDPCPYSVCVADSHAYVAADEHGLRIINISNPSNPQEVACYGGIHGVGNVHVVDSYAYIATRSSVFKVIDVSSPASAQEAGSCDLPGGRANDIFVDGVHAYVAMSGDFCVIDISSPTNPQLIADTALAGYAYGLHVFDSYAYVASISTGVEGGLYIIDIAIPTDPQIVFLYQCAARDVFVIDSYAYIAARDYLLILDVSDPTNPLYVGHHDTPGYANSVYVSDSFAYVADGDSGLRIIDVSDPSTPQEISSYVGPRENWCRTYVSGPYAYIPGVVLDISDPTNPQEVGFYYTPWARGFYVSDPYIIYAAYGSCGLQIYEFSPTGVEQADNSQIHQGSCLLQNPVSGNYIELMFNVTYTESPVLDLYNILGQKVKTFSLGEFSSGKHKVRLPINEIVSGVYFLNIAIGESKETKKILLIR